MHTTSALCFTVVAFAAACASNAGARSAEADYARLCSGCHGASFQSPAATGTSARSSEELAAAIRGGVPGKDMPAFGARLSEAQIQALTQLVQAAVTGSPMLGVTVKAEALDEMSSGGYVLLSTDQPPQTHYVGYFGERSLLCYRDIDLTGARSIEFNYARGGDDPGRFAILVGDEKGTPRINLGEKRTASTGGWQTFERRRVGLDRTLSGRHLLCLYGVEGGGIFNLDSFALSDRPGEHDGLTLSFESASEQVITAGGYRFVLEKVADTSAEPWSMAFLPDASMILTQKSGQLWLFKDGKGARIEGIPKVWDGVQGGLLAVKPHPSYASNGWIYLTFSDPGVGNATSMTRVVRGKLDGVRWVDQQDVYRASAEFYTQHYAHFGSRVAFAEGYIYISVGERQQPALVQDLATPYGKIHRLHDDGRVPHDNPFVGREGALGSIWSYGHRNPQGMTAHPSTGTIWSAEHGPAGGDEINLVRKGANYGWPLVSFGTHYDGTPVGESPYLEGVEAPIHHFTPSIAVSQIEFYLGDEFPDWRGQLLVASLGAEELRLVHVRDNQVMNDRLLFKGFGRIRDVVVGPDGYPYVLLLNDISAGIHRLRPIASAPAGRMTLARMAKSANEE